MLQGRFGNTSGRPYFEGRVTFPDLGLAANISFIFDTGADTSILMPIDGHRLGLDYCNLTSGENCLGIGGLSQQFVEPGMMAFTDPGSRVHVYFLDIRIAAPTADIASIPSLLGRDIIDNWAVTYDKQNDRLSANVIKSDMQLILK